MHASLFLFFQERLQVGFSTIRELILKRPATQLQLLETLLELTTNEKEQVRVQAIHSAKKLHIRPELAEHIEVSSYGYSKQHLRKRLSIPPSSLQFPFCYLSLYYEHFFIFRDLSIRELEHDYKDKICIF